MDGLSNAVFVRFPHVSLCPRTREISRHVKLASASLFYYIFPKNRLGFDSKCSSPWYHHVLSGCQLSLPQFDPTVLLQKQRRSRRSEHRRSACLVRRCHLSGEIFRTSWSDAACPVTNTHDSFSVTKRSLRMLH